MSEPAMAPVPHGPLAELWNRTTWRVTVYFAVCVLIGALGALIWSWVTPLAAYTINPDLSAGISERGMAELVAPDVSFSLITGVIGLIGGVAGWLVLHRRGWPVTVVPPLAAFAAALMTWRLGIIIGVSGFADRIAVAQAGDLVQVDLELHSLSALLIGPFAAVTPIMLLAAFWPERPEGAPVGEPLTNH